MKRTSFSKVLAPAITLAVAVNMSSCIDPTIYYPPGPAQPSGPNDSGARFKSDLERAIASSDRIVVLQHSHESDFANVVPAGTKAPYYSYGSHVLSSAAKADFLNRTRYLSAYNSRPSNQPFDPHHTIKFYSAGRLKSSMRVSFSSREVRWNGSRYTASQDILRAVGPVISNAGFRTSRDWKGVARIEYASGRRPSSGSIGSGGGFPTPPSVNPNLPDPPITPPKPAVPKVPTAEKVPGKPGMVYNPFTKNEVDVNGIPSGTKVRDPHDSNPAHIFKVP